MQGSGKKMTEQHPIWIRNLIIFFALVGLISGGILFYDIREIHEQKIVHPRNPLGVLHGGTGQKLASGSISDVNYIDAWMTFSYINTTFHLPDTYLREQLMITHPKYPRITIRAYAKSIQQDPTILVQHVQNVVRDSFYPEIHR